MKYYLIKANDMKKTEFVGEYYFDLQQEPIELTKEDIKQILTENLPSDSKVLNKIRKVLE